MTTTTITRKIGRNRGKPRLWIEGAALVEAGLDHGNRWNLVTTSTGFLIVRHPEGKRKIAGKPGRPIIDIAGATLPEVVVEAGAVSISYQPGGGLMVVKPVTGE